MKLPGEVDLPKMNAFRQQLQDFQPEFLSPRFYLVCESHQLFKHSPSSKIISTTSPQWLLGVLGYFRHRFKQILQTTVLHPTFLPSEPAWTSSPLQVPPCLESASDWWTTGKLPELQTAPDLSRGGHHHLQHKFFKKQLFNLCRAGWMSLGFVNTLNNNSSTCGGQAGCTVAPRRPSWRLLLGLWTCMWLTLQNKELEHHCAFMCVVVLPPHLHPKVGFQLQRLFSVRTWPGNTIASNLLRCTAE